MNYHEISVSLLIAAPAKKVYSIIADYQNGHPHILPKPAFESLTVEKGGFGAGTEVSCTMKLAGRRQTFHAVITEPEPGRVLVETIPASGSTTTFTVEPRNDGAQAYVTITTRVNVRGGLLGAIEKRLTTRALQPIYEKELQQLSDFVVPSLGN
jgi:uncharacterized protein YndB with AHSA1/START domain